MPPFSGATGRSFPPEHPRKVADDTPTGLTPTATLPVQIPAKQKLPGDARICSGPCKALLSELVCLLLQPCLNDLQNAIVGGVVSGRDK